MMMLLHIQARSQLAQVSGRLEFKVASQLLVPIRIFLSCTRLNPWCAETQHADSAVLTARQHRAENCFYKRFHQENIKTPLLRPEKMIFLQYKQSPYD